MPGAEFHYVNRAAWLRAAVLGANDGIISTASLIVGVAAAEGSRGEILTAAVAGWAAGAMSMAAGEYVSVSSQANSETARFGARATSAPRPAGRGEGRARPYLRRPRIEAEAPQQVAGQLMAKDALDAHARDELGLSEGGQPRPIQAAFASALAFSVGAAAPTLTAFLRRKAPSPSPSLPPHWHFWSRSAPWRLGRRRTDRQASAEGRLLGRARDGGDGGHRRGGRQGGLTLGRPACAQLTVSAL